MNITQGYKTITLKSIWQLPFTFTEYLSIFSFPKKKQDHFKRGFTLFEVVIVVVILAIIGVVGMRTRTYAVDAKKFQATMEQMWVIKRAIVGDERLTRLGYPVSFGYLGRTDDATFPAPESGDEIPTGLLRTHLPYLPYREDSETNGDTYKYDAWGNKLIYNDSFIENGETYVEIRCVGKDGIDDDTQGRNIFDYGFHLLIHKSYYEGTGRDVLINVMDNQGTILRGATPAPSGEDPPPAQWWDHQIYDIQFEVQGPAPRHAVSPTLSYAQGLFTATGLPVNYYVCYIYPTDGTDSSGDHGGEDHRDDLTCGRGWAAAIVPIYPKNPDLRQYWEIRLPGTVDKGEL